MTAIPFIGRARQVTADALLFKNNKLSFPERMEMIGRSVIMNPLAIPVGSAVYWLVTQVHYLWQYPVKNGTSSLVNVNLKPIWDNLPVYLDHAFSTGWFARTLPPGSWDTVRHDTRHVLISLIVMVLLGAVRIGLKKYDRATPLRMAVSVPAAFAASLAVVIGLSLAFVRLIPGTANWGISQHVPVLSDFFAQLPLTVIGITAGLVASRILARTFATVQMMSVDRNIAQGDTTITPLKRVLYGPVYVKRMKITSAQVEEGTRTVKIGKPVLGFVIAMLIPFLLFLAGVGFWLLYFGPAKGA